MALTDHRPTGLLRLLLRLPLWLYRARLGWLAGHRLVYIAHRGRHTGARHEVVAEVVRYDPTRPEVVVIAAWGGKPDWYRNLVAGPAVEIRIGGQRWPHPAHRFPDEDEIYRMLRAYQRAHPGAWRRLAPLLGFPTQPDDPRWAQIGTAVHAIAFAPGR
ncbi:MAG TPA: nitroreductase family deazaflavin-dependent oxidoreductase [Pseudonocardiaceae bacterium]|jgi:deazaflavin-dependent oxidoreductase (nitroreductase family)|nr:nitroreductase family deazaflavin-dependent oxidoreductase [Pseudonocardiaceae bacterium]